MNPMAIRNAGFLILLMTAAGCGGQRDRPRLGEVERLPRLETVRPEIHARLALVRTYLATVEPFEKADLCAHVRGYVAGLSAGIDIGRAVKKGDLLAQLAVPDLVAERNNKKAFLEQMEKTRQLAEQTIAVSQAEVKETEALVKRYQAEENFRKLQSERVTQLAQGNTVSQQLAEEGQLQFQAARAALAAAQAQVVTKQARWQSANQELHVADSRIKVARAELEKAEALVDFASLRAPFDGIITKRWVDAGATIKDASTPLLTIMRTDKVRVLLDIPERDVPYVATNGGDKGVGNLLPGRPEGDFAPKVPDPFFPAGGKGNAVELHIPSLQGIIGNQKFRGQITLIASALDPITRTMRAEVHLDNQLNGQVGLLKPQMTGTATVVLAERQAITVPSSSLVRAGSKVEIYIVADPTGDPPRGIVKRLEVQLGLDDGQRVEIRNDRLAGRELVIVKGAGVIRPGDEVLAIPPRPLEGSIGHNGGD